MYFCFRKIVLSISLLLTLTACSSTREVNQLSFNDIRNIERSTIGANEQSAIGLALSGGGTRSASFNIGLLAGLNGIGFLEDIDYISSVSGGSYAAYWYYTKLYYKDNSADVNNSDFFNLCFSKSILLEEEDVECVKADKSFRFQRHLQNNSLILKKHSMKKGTDNDRNWGHFTPIVLRSLYEPIASNSLEFFGLNNNIYSARDYYREGLERTYGLYPNESNLKGLMSGEFISADDSLHRSNGHKYRAEFLSMASLSDRLYDSDNNDNPPIWIINTTV
ncbi:patatin-like phospholipase family protein [Vibrio astriarenae]|uniref:patatin-like phospholipase family protein n=1 Tax=Vibrio astriarenae TaxID=1481923 RepID=UPI003734E101